MTKPWLASASPKFTKSPANTGNKTTEDAGSSCPIATAISSEIHSVRSAIESRFNKSKETSSPKNPFLDPRYEQSPPRHEPSLARHPRVHIYHLPPPVHPDHSRHYAAPARTADPRLAQYDYRLPDPRSQHRSTRREKRYGGHYAPPPPGRYDSPPPLPRSPRTAAPPGYYHARTPDTHSPSHWPNEKTPTSPYHPRQPPSRTPSSPKHYPQQAPHTAHPAGSFPRFDSPLEKGRSPHAAGPGSAPGREPLQSGNRRRIFEKVKAALSPNSVDRSDVNPQEPYPSPAYSPIPPPRSEKSDTRQRGYYEYQTPAYQTSFDYKPGINDPRTPSGEVPAQDINYAVPDDEKYNEVEEENRPKTLEEKLKALLARLRYWLASKLQRPRSRIPSVQPDLETQAIEEIEKQLREAFVLSWTTVAGAWLIQFTTFGYIWSFGVFQDFYLNNYPTIHTSAPRVAWIGSLQLMLTFALGVLSGKLFDAGWFHFVTMLGSILFGMGNFVLSFVDARNFTHLFLVQGLLMGIGGGLIFIPSVLVVQLHFPERKALMTGIVMSGSSFGAMIYPIMLDKLLPSKGFNGAVRATSYMVVGLLVIANCLVSVPPKKWSPRYPRVDLVAYLKEIHYASACGGIFLVFLTMWFPQYYIEEFAVKHGVNAHLAFYSLALISLGGMAGRVVMGLAADKYGPWTVLIPTTFVITLMVCLVAVLKNVAAVVLISILYGFSSGAWLSLLISALSALAIRPSEMGQRTGFALTVGSMGAFLTGSAQAGLLSDKFVWARPIGLFAFLLIAATGIFGYVRYLVSLKRRFVYV